MNLLLLFSVNSVLFEQAIMFIVQRNVLYNKFNMICCRPTIFCKFMAQSELFCPGSDQGKFKVYAHVTELAAR